MSQASYKGVLLDIDDTLYDYDAAHEMALRAALSWISGRSGIGYGALEEGYDKARSTVNLELSGTASSHNRLLYFQRLLEAAGMNPLEHALDAYEAYWGSFIEGISLYEDAEAFLMRLKGRKVCLVTDLTAHIQYRKVRKLGLDRYAGFMVTSEEAGRDKPDPRIFRMAMDKLGLGPAEVCMVGDSLDKDMKGAAALGIRCFWMDRKGRPGGAGGPVTKVASFDELMGYIL